MVKNKIVNGSIILTIPFRESFNEIADEDFIVEYIKENINDFLETDCARVLDVDIENMEITGSENDEPRESN